jgi:sulfofructose kinase
VAQDHLEDLGGPAAVASIAVAQLGGDAVFVGARGDDAAGERVAAYLQARGVDTRWYRIVPGGRTPVVGVIVVPGGERFIFGYPGRDLPDDPAWVPSSGLAGADAVLLDSRYPCAGAALAQAARASGVPVVLDFDVDTPAAWALATAADYVIADEDLARRMGGSVALLERIHAAGSWGAVTLGASGVVHLGGHVPAFQVTARDTTGAGDVFHGAFALAIAEGRTAKIALLWASAAAALKCETGRVPTRDSVESLLDL